MAANTPHISLVAETITHLGPLPVTNSLITTWILIILLSLVAIYIGKSAKNSRISLLAETAIGSLKNLFADSPFFSLLATLFIFIIISNWSGLIPGLSAITYTPHSSGEFNIANHKSIPLIRAPTADINTTLALSIVTMLAIQYYGFKVHKTGYLKKFFNFKSPVDFFVGILELVSEISRLISFTFRLFGNIFAGEVLLAVIAFLIPVLIPAPFIGLEIFVGFIQAMVFTLLASSFIKLAGISHDIHKH